jgi:hypothetical protein
VQLSASDHICVLSKVYHRGIGRFSLPRNFRVISRFHQKRPRNSYRLQRRGSPSTRDFSRNHAGCRVSRLMSAVRPSLAPFTRRVFNAGNLQGLLCTQQLAGFCHSRLKGGSLQSTPHVSSDGVSRQQLNVTRNAAKWKQVSFTSTNAPENGQSLSLVSLDIKFLFSSHVEKLLGSIKVFEKAEQGG